ncbi:hydroxylysine kinase-like [Glandiceps talaboti]
MKIINTAESANTDFIDGLIEVLLYLRKEGIRCPEPCTVVNGEYLSWQDITESGRHAVYFQTYIEGVPVGTVNDSSLSLYRAGVFLANMDNALKNFHHQGFVDKRTIWRLESIPALRSHLHLVKDEAHQQLVISVIKTFEDEVVTSYSKLQKGVIHGDFSPNNLIVMLDTETFQTSNNVLCDNSLKEYSISGIIDFGDAMFSCYVFEVAMAISMFMMESGCQDKVSIRKNFEAGYESKFFLNNCERALLDVCIAARLVQIAVLGTGELQNQPENEYIRNLVMLAWQQLTLMSSNDHTSGNGDDRIHTT